MLWELLRYPSADPRAQVYWRRRMSVVAVVTVIALLMLVLLLRGGGGSNSVTPTAAVQPAAGAPAPSAAAVAPAGSGSAAPAAGAGSGAATTPSPTVSPAVSPSASPSPTASGSAGTTCAPGSMALRLASDAPSYAAGVDPVLTLSVVDIGSQPCAVDLGTTATSLSVLSAGKQVWSSSACTAKLARPTPLTPAAAQMLKLTWDRTRNAAGCGPGSPLPAGQYEIVARVGGSAVYGGSLVLS